MISRRDSSSCCKNKMVSMLGVDRSATDAAILQDAGSFPGGPAVFPPVSLPLSPASPPFHAAPSAGAPFHAMPYGVEIANRVFVGGCPYNVRKWD